MSLTKPGDEFWKPIPSAPNYEASSLGRIRSLPRRYTKGGIKAETISYGYRRVNLSINRKMKMCLVHRLILEAFGGPAPPGHEASHLDGVKLNCQPDNLVWATRSENALHKKEHGTLMSGERCHAAKLTRAKADYIRAAKGKIMQKDLAKQFGVARSTIQRIQYGERWA